MGGSVSRPVSPPVPVERHKEMVQRFYDMCSTYYADVWGEHIHDGYYNTGREPREEAQENLVRHLADGARIAKEDRVLDVGCGIGGGFATFSSSASEYWHRSLPSPLFYFPCLWAA